MLCSVFAAGFLAGVTVTALYSPVRRLGRQVTWPQLAIIGLVVASLGGVLAQELSFLQATLIILFGSAALMAAARLIELLQRGEAIELQSHWGGLGGALGGWRLSPPASLLLLTLVLSAGLAGLATSVRSDRDEKKGMMAAVDPPPAKANAPKAKDSPVEVKRAPAPSAQKPSDQRSTGQSPDMPAPKQSGN
jgi:hypothetical protein